MEVKVCSELQKKKMEVEVCSGRKKKKMEVKVCSELQKKKMEVKVCSELQGEKKKKKKMEVKKKKTEGKRSLFYVFRKYSRYHIYKLDLSRHFVPATADINYFGRGKATRKRKRKMQMKRPPRMLRPYMAFESIGMRKEGEFPNDMAVAALGSKIYLIGGNLSREDKPLPGDVYEIDTAEDYPEIRKMPCKLNWGKRQPIAWTIRGSIYVMPHTFSQIEFHYASFHHCPRATGKFFERYDTDSNSWKILPNPPAEKHLPCADEKSDPLLVKSHAVLGSTLLISLATVGFVYAFDASRPDLGWKKIELELGARGRLSFLPFDPDYSSPVGDDLLLCYPRHKLQPPDNRVSDLVERELGIRCGTDYYLCRFDDIAVSGSDLKASIVPLKGSPMEMRWDKFFTCNKSSQLSWLGDGLVLFAKIGCDFDLFAPTCGCSKCEPEHEIGDTYMSFELFRVSPSPDHDRQIQASPTCSALFKLDEDPPPRLDFSRCFLMEDGLFLT